MNIDIRRILPSINVDSQIGHTLNSAESREILRGAFVPIVNQDTCIKMYKRKNKVTPQMICAGYLEGGKDSCQGDSGGPLTKKMNGEAVLVGVVSWGWKCAESNHAGVYSRVTSVRPWIKSVTGI